MAKIGLGNPVALKKIAQRDQLWPGCEPWLWNRKGNKGFATIPKTMPIILQIMDDLSNGKPVSSTYLGLWCETWDNSMVAVSNQQSFSYAAGFTGQRAAYTWASRIKILNDLNFISVKPGKFGEISHILIWNPHRIIRWHRQQRTIGMNEMNFNALLERALEIGANDMTDDINIEFVEPSPSS
jgi:hypothetical protein